MHCRLSDMVIYNDLDREWYQDQYMNEVLNTDPFDGDDEEWRDIPGYPNYRVSSLGRVFSKLTGQLLHLNRGKNGYLYVNLRGGDRYRETVQHLVARAFVPNDDPKSKRVLRHLNDVKTDNRSENLVWGTYKENVEDAKRNGRITNDMYRLSARKARLARQRAVRLTNIETGEVFDFESCAQAARYLGVHPSHISVVLHGKYDSLHGYYADYI